jgi:predicted site-specific integrase-resolvase
MAAKIRHKAGEYAIKQLTAPMGISAPTLRAYCKRTNIEVTARYEKKPIMTADDIQALPVNNKELAEWRQEGKFKGAVWLETLDGKCKFIPTQEGAARAGNNGRAFRMVKQLANHYKAGA